MLKLTRKIVFSSKNFQQIRGFKRIVTSSDLNPSKYKNKIDNLNDNKFNKFMKSLDNESMKGKNLYKGKYGSSIYDHDTIYKDEKKK